MTEMWEREKNKLNGWIKKKEIKIMKNGGVDISNFKTIQYHSVLLTIK